MAVECEKAGIGYDCIEDVKVDGIVVSSTYIRQLIAQGDMEGAAKFLGHPYTVTGIVEHGRRVGTSVLKVPTVNLRLPSEMALPPYGVYATRVLVDGKDGELLTARTEGGRLVRFPGRDDMIGTYQNITITAATTWSLSGKAADIC